MTSAARLLMLLALLATTLIVAVRMGAVPLDVSEVIRAVGGEGDPAAVAIVRELRLPRSILAALAGAALAISGATFQALLRNPLAEPYILGVSGGAALGAVVVIVVGLASTPIILALAAFAGAVVAILAVLRIAVAVDRALDTRILLLAGVVAAAFFNACILLALTFADAESFRSAIFWMMGSFSGATWSGTGALALYLIPGAGLLLALARPLDLLAIGEDTATHLGVRVDAVKLVAYGGASLLTAASVAVAGVIGFVGLVIPHFLRLLWGDGHRFLLPASALLGAAFLVATDALARTVAAPVEIPVGVLTAFIGVPFFLWVLRRPIRSARRNARPVAGEEVAVPPVPLSPTALAPLPVPSTLTPHPAASPQSSPGPACIAEGLRFTYPGSDLPAVRDVEVHVQAGQITALLGPNGSGKSTVLRMISGSLVPDTGRVAVLGRPLDEWERRALAREVGVVQQTEEIAFPITTRDFIALGRFPYLGNWRREGPADREAIRQAMRICDVEEFVDRPVRSLSGGERQRVRIARALAQEPSILLLDEPTVALDIRHEMAIFELLRTLAAEGVAVLIVTHNLNLAARYADRLLLLETGRLVAAGRPESVLTREVVEAVYRWPVRITPHPGPGPDTGAPQVAPLNITPSNERPIRDIAERFRANP